MLQNPSKQGHLSQTLDVSKLPKSVSINKSRTPTSSTPQEGLVPSIPNEEPQKQRAGGNLLNQKKILKKQVFCQIQKWPILHPKKWPKGKTTTNHNKSLEVFLGNFSRHPFSFQIPCPEVFFFWSIPLICPPPVGTVSLSCWVIIHLKSLQALSSLVDPTWKLTASFLVLKIGLASLPQGNDLIFHLYQVFMCPPVDGSEIRLSLPGLVVEIPWFREF